MNQEIIFTSSSTTILLDKTTGTVIKVVPLSQESRDEVAILATIPVHPNLVKFIESYDDDFKVSEDTFFDQVSIVLDM